jgi:4-diphosphocytidyl-2-C-methyl-D-erythritol kinase
MSAERDKPAVWLAPCKINPTLVVIERREDGFHELDLSYLALELCDRLELHRSNSAVGRTRLSGPMAFADVPAGAENLARRGAALVLDIARRRGLEPLPADWDLELRKIVPSQAGLGGGSSDAAAAVLASATSCGLSCEDPELLEGLGRLGADCIFFLAARSSGHARGRGRGERIEVLAPARLDFWVALLTPQVGAPTAQVYSKVKLVGDARSARERGQRAFDAWQRANSLTELREATCNELEPAALRAVGELVRWRELLDQECAGHFQLSGSGSSFFGLFSGAPEAQEQLDRLSVAAAQRGLALRGTWVLRAAGHGAARAI